MDAPQIAAGNVEIARLLGWPENRVRVKVAFLGGGYGAKLYIKLEALVTALSMIAKRPVKVALPFEEMFYTITRHPTTFRIKSAVDADGRLTARREADRRMSCGPAADAVVPRSYGAPSTARSRSSTARRLETSCSPWPRRTTRLRTRPPGRLDF